MFAQLANLLAGAFASWRCMSLVRETRRRCSFTVVRILCGLCLLTLTACSKPLEAGDRDQLLTVDRLVPYGIVLPDDYQSYETASRTGWLYGSVALQYEFQATGGEQLPYVFSTAERHTTSIDACLTYNAMKFGASLASMEHEVRNNFFSYGDQSEFSVLTQDGEAIGHSFGMCKGRRSFYVIMVGIHFDTADGWASLIMPVLRSLESD